MSLETVVEDIRKTAQAEIDRMKREAKEEAEGILREANSKKAKIIGDAMVEAKKAADRLRTHELARAELENKRARLVMEKHLLDEVIERARERIKNLPKDKDDALMRSIVRKHSSEGAIVHTDARHAPLVRTACSLRLAEPIDCLGGIVIESSDGSVRYDYTYDTILQVVADSTMKEVARILFQD
jgi:V/A-type H+-transporting ATPase subunit E